MKNIHIFAIIFLALIACQKLEIEKLTNAETVPYLDCTLVENAVKEKFGEVIIFWSEAHTDNFDRYKQPDGISVFLENTDTTCSVTFFHFTNSKNPEITLCDLSITGEKKEIADFFATLLHEATIYTHHLGERRTNLFICWVGRAKYYWRGTYAPGGNIWYEKFLPKYGEGSYKNIRIKCSPGGDVEFNEKYLLTLSQLYNIHQYLG